MNDSSGHGISENELAKLMAEMGDADFSAIPVGHSPAKPPGGKVLTQAEIDALIANMNQ